MALIANVDQYEDTKVAIEMVKEILAYRNGLMTSMDPSSTDPPLDPIEILAYHNNGDASSTDSPLDPLRCIDKVG
ncbi:8150_t:CDS:2 [Rhizophagus irregularis]|nr:8150_t:CDS:2 [Rhizophagus irregularis]